MPATLTFPGVYIEEIRSSVHTITGVATSIGAFIGFFTRGPMNQATQIFSTADLEREFGGLDARSEAGYAIQQFFLNGGTQAWVVRTAAAAGAPPIPPTAAAVQLRDAVGGTAILLATAANEGTWGNNVRIDIDYATTDPATTFNVVVTELATVGGKIKPVTTEIFRNLIADPTKSNHVIHVVNDGSNLVKLQLIGTVTPGQRPAQTGTISDAITTALLAGLDAADAMSVNLNATAKGTLTLGSPVPTTAPALAAALQAKLRRPLDPLDPLDPSLARTTVNVVGSATTGLFLLLKPGTDAAPDVLSFTGTLADKLGVSAAAKANVQSYALGGDTVGAQEAAGATPVLGSDGDLPDAAALIGDPGLKTGLNALLDVDLFNILCIPDTVRLADDAAARVAAEAEAFCESRRAFYILDVPQADQTRDQIDEVKQWLDENSTLRNKNAALYYPRPLIADPLNDFRLRLVAASGTVAGVYARTDGDRGVWKAPAGTEASLRGVQQLEYLLTDQENGVLNPVAINCLRNFPIYGNVCWGARTLDGADQQASEWKYIPVRRTALFIEESLYRGTQWVVFEPNDEPLWAQIRLNLGAFMQTLFRQGAFQGSTPRDAYFVKCDKETTTQNDIDLGIVNILVGFAPLKPAEFVVIKLQQIAGQIAV